MALGTQVRTFRRKKYSEDKGVHDMTYPSTARKGRSGG